MNANDPLFIDVHALQTVPPNNMNRDDTGSPKTASFGGVTRARVSSQSWKKAIRDDFASLLDTDELGVRTKEAALLVARFIREANSEISEDTAAEMGREVLEAAGIKVDSKNLTGYLLFISPIQARKLAELVIAAHIAGSKIDKKEAKVILNIKENPNLNAIDIALFGRMVADAPDLNVDAAVQVAHAIGVGRAASEFDYFTALDDLQPDEETGAAMINTTEFLSETLYRYATIDVRHLFENLGSVRATARAIEAFVKAFVTSMPTGKQNSFANRTLPAAVVVQLRQTQPVSLANAFERPVDARSDKGTIATACERLVEQEQALDGAFGVAPFKTYVIVGDPCAQALVAMRSEGAADITSLAQMTASLADDAGAYLGQADEA